MKHSNPGTETREFTPRSIGVIVASAITLLLSSGTLSTTTQLFFVTLTQEFGWSQTQYTSLNAICTGSCALAGFFLGRLTDKWGVRKVVLPVAFFTGFAIMGLSLLNGSFLQALALYFIAGIGAATAVCYFRLVAVTFRSRLGLAMSISAMVSGLLMGTLGPPLYNAVFEAVGWRQSFVIWGVVYLLVAVPVQLLFARDPVGAMKGQRSAPNANEVGLTLKEAFATKALWLIFFVDLFAILISTGARVHVVPFVLERGLAREAAVAALSVSALGALALRPLFGWVVDRFDTPKVVIPFAALTTAGLVTLLTGGGTLPVLLVAMTMLNAGAASESGVGNYFLTRFYGRRYYGQIVSVIYVATPLGIGLGPLLLGFLHDRLGGYTEGLWVLGGLSVICIALLAMLGPYRYAANAGGRPQAEPEAAPAVTVAPGTAAVGGPAPAA